MIRILLVCNAGMSTSMLVKKMQDYALKTDIEAKIWAVGDAASVKEVEKADIVCLGPQVRYLEKKMNERVKHEKPVMVIDFTAYGSMNGEKVLKDAIACLKNYRGE